MRRPRILIWTESYWVGGSDRFVADLLSSIGDDVEIALAGNVLRELDDWLAERLPHVAPRAVRPVSNLVDSPAARLRGRLARTTPELSAGTDGPTPGPSLVGAGTAVLRARAAGMNLVRARRLMRSARPDAVLINNGGYPGGESCRLIAAAAGAAGVPRVVHAVHNMAYPRVWPEWLERRLDRLGDSGTTTWTTAAERASDALAALRGIERARIRTVHYGTPEPPAPTMDRESARAAMGFGPEDVGILTVAAFEPRKGHRVLIDAARELPTGARLALVGRGPEEEAVREQVRAAGLEDRVAFLGWRDDVDALLPAADVLTLPSLGNECLPYAILEAMAHGLPVVGTDVAGIPEEVEDGVTGRVVPPADAAALAAALRAVVTDRGGAAAMGAAGRARWERVFRLERMVDTYRELLLDGVPA